MGNLWKALYEICQRFNQQQLFLRLAWATTTCWCCTSIHSVDDTVVEQRPKGFHSLQEILPGQPPSQRQEFSLFLVQHRQKRWSEAQQRHLLENFLKNSDGTYSGAMWASLSAGRAPGTLGGDDLGEANYRFHWVRDSALAISAILDLLEKGELSTRERPALEQLVRAFAGFSQRSQKIPLQHDWLLYTEDGHQVWGSKPPGEGAIEARYGEAKYQAVKKDLGNGAFSWEPAAFDEPWGRPQNDGPALRASAMSRIINYFLDKKDQGHELSQDEKTAIATALDVLKEDVEYTKSAWRRRSVDPWEEVEADHFFTRVVQSEALERTIQAYGRLKLPTSALETERAALEASLDKFWDDSKGHIIASLNINPNASVPKKAVLDVAVLIGAARRKRGRYSSSDSRVLATAAALLDAFKKDASAAAQGLPGVAVGRYPDDPWNGHDRVAKPDGTPVTHGHPWVLATLTMGEIFHRAAIEMEESGRVEINGENRPFFEYVFGGSLPTDVAAALNEKQIVTFHKNRDPIQYENLMKKLVARGAGFPARLFVSGVPLTATTHEQFTGNPHQSKRQVGPSGLGWNCAKALEALRNAVKAFSLVLP